MTCDRLYLLHVGYETNAEAEDDRSKPRRLITLVCKTSEGITRILTVASWLPWVYARDITSSSSDRKVLWHQLGNAGIESVDYVKRVQAVGFSNNRQRPYAKVRVRRWPPWPRDEAFKARLFEQSVKPHSKFLCETALRTGAWFDCAAPSDATSCDMSDLTPALDDATPPRLTVVAYDLETSGLDPNTCDIHQVCLVVWDTSGPVAPDPRSVVLCTQPTAVVRGTHVVVVEGEKELLVQMRAFLRRHDADVLVGFNLTFDNGFLQRRLQRYTGVGFETLARPETAKARFVKKVMKTAALGANELVLWDIPGRVVIDLFMFAKSNYPTLPNFKLNTCGQTFVGAGKDDVPWGSILAGFADPEAVELRGEIAAYCLQDGFLCLQLMEKWSAHIACAEEAAACAMNMGAVPDSGRQIKVISLLLAEIYDQYVYNPPAGADEDEEEEAGVGYEGATVIDTVKGFYGGPCDQVVLLDFASLYPSLIRAHRVSPDRLVRQDHPDEVAASQLPGVKITEHHVAEGHIVRLATPYPDNGNGKPYFYNILQKLLDERAAVRKSMKTETDRAKLKILDARQKAKKVSANSAYGLLGCKRGYMPLPDLAAVTTYQGRQALQLSKRVAEEEYGAITVAGDTDSIMVVLPPQPGVPTPAEPDEAWKAARIKYAFEHGAAIGDDISSRLPEELVFELEGVMFPAAFYNKKRYAAVLWEKPERPEPELKMRGVVAVRNDSSLLAKQTATAVLKMGIQLNDPEGAVAHVRQLLRDMRDGKLPLSQFVISKQLHDLSPKVISPHVALCKRLLKTHPMEVPALGSKVEFVIVRGHAQLSDASRRPCDASVAELDLKYYFERQLLKPLTELLGPLIGGGEAKLKKLLLDDLNRHGQPTMYAALGLPEPKRGVTKRTAADAVAVAEAAAGAAAGARAAEGRTQTLYQALGVAPRKNKLAAPPAAAAAKSGGAPARKKMKQGKLNFGM